MSNQHNPLAKNEVTRIFTILRDDLIQKGKDASDFGMMYELLDRISVDILLVDIKTMSVDYTTKEYENDRLTLTITYVDSDIAPKLIQPGTIGFHSRIQIEYEWELGETGRFTAKLFENGKLEETVTDYYSNIVAQVIFWQHDYNYPIYTCGKWVSDRLWEKSAIKALWF